MPMFTAIKQHMLISTLFTVFASCALATDVEKSIETFISNGLAYQNVIDDAALAELCGRSIHLAPTDIPVILWDEFDLNQNRVNKNIPGGAGMYNITVDIEKP